MITQIVKLHNITSPEYAGMYTLFSRYYENVDAERFRADWQSKHWAIMLKTDAGEIAGFSTLQTYRHHMTAGPVEVVYSGDTVVDRAHRTNGYLAGAFGHFLLRMVDASPEGCPVCWLLTSKGVRTYRFLPVFFNTFFPAFDRDTPSHVKQLLDEIAHAKFGDAYSPENQTISHRGRRDRVCPSEHEPCILQRRDPHIQFFLKQNPGYAAGDELACLTPMNRENLNARGRRVIAHTEVVWRE
jgi:hypothetical protein